MRKNITSRLIPWNFGWPLRLSSAGAEPTLFDDRFGQPAVTKSVRIQAFRRPSKKSPTQPICNSMILHTLMQSWGRAPTASHWHSRCFSVGVLWHYEYSQQSLKEIQQS